MPEADEILAFVRDAIRETMSDDALAVELSMRLMDDLLEESLNMLDLQFRLDRHYGVRVPGVGSFAGVETDNEGRFTAVGLAALRSKLPDSLLDRFQEPALRPTAKELWYAITVADLVNLIAMAVANKTLGETPTLRTPL